MKTMYDELLKIRSRGKIPFHMPGSRGGQALPDEYKRDVLALDYTEIEETDNYRHPTGIIKEAHLRIAEAYGAKKSIISVNGATCGILAAFGYISKAGKKVIVDRNCHISVINALQMFKIPTVFVMPEYMENYGATGKVSIDKLEKVISAHSDAAAVFITSPNYYGICSDIEKISALCRKNDMLLCVDAAHGAHFAFSNNLPECAVSAGADIVIHSVHKTLVSLTQTAVVLLSDKIDSELFSEWMWRFTTTSPSYILMAYADFSVQYMRRGGAEIYEKLKIYIDNFKKNCPIDIMPSDDFSRIVLHSSANGYKLAEFLREKNIEPEAADLSNVILIAGAGNTEQHFKMLENACAEYKNEPRNISVPEFICSSDVYMPIDGLYAKTQKIALETSAGRKTASPITVYPPGVPMLLPGETITKADIQYIKTVQSFGGTVLGIENGVNAIKQI